MRRFLDRQSGIDSPEIRKALEAGFYEQERGMGILAQEHFAVAVSIDLLNGLAWFGLAMTELGISTPEEFEEYYIEKGDPATWFFQKTKIYAKGELARWLEQLQNKRKEALKELIRTRLEQYDGPGGRIPVIASSADWAVGLKPDGTVFSVALCDDAVENDFSHWTDIESVSAGRYHLLGVCQDGSVVTSACPFDADFGQNRVEKWSQICSASGGGKHSVGLTEDGKLVTVGPDDMEDAWQETQCWDSVVEVAAGGNHIAALREDGTVLALSCDQSCDWGQCETRNWKNIVALDAGDRITVGLDMDRKVHLAGPVQYSGLESAMEWTDLKAIAAGNNHLVGLKTDGSVVVAERFPGNGCCAQNWQNVRTVWAGFDTIMAMCCDGSVRIAKQMEHGWEDLSHLTKDWNLQERKEET